MPGRRLRRLGLRVHRALFAVMGPAQVGRYTPRQTGDGVPEGGTATLPPGYHFESYVDPSGIKRRIATPDQPTDPPRA